jgi:ribonuclease BN (tRNA processing enzyme)
MEIFFLGTGTSIPHSQHSPAGLAIRAAQCTLLFDIGPGTLGRLHAAGIPYDRVDQLLLTHLHPDHTLDLATLLLAFNYAPGAERTAPFPLTGGRDLPEFLDRLVTLYPEVAPVGFDLQLRQAYRDEWKIDGLDLRCAPTGHTENSVGYCVDDGQHRVVYSGDASPRGELAQLAARADLLVTECSFPSGWQTEDHLNADTVGDIAQQADVKALIITHCYPPALAVDLVSQIGRRYRGDVRLAYDGLHITM